MWGLEVTELVSIGRPGAEIEYTYFAVLIVPATMPATMRTTTVMKALKQLRCIVANILEKS